MRPEVVCQLMNTKEEAGHLGQYLYRTRSIYGLHKTNHLHSDVMIWKLFFGITGPLWGESTDDFCIIGPLWEESTDDFCIIGTFVRGIQWSPMDSPHKGLVIHSFDIFFDISLNKLLKKQLSGQWFEMPWHPIDNIKRTITKEASLKWSIIDMQ